MRGAAFLWAGAVAAGAGGCGGSDFKREASPPVPVQLTGVIQQGKVTVSPDRVGAGPILITISNQTSSARTVTLDDGSRVEERVGPINPLDTATLQKTLAPGAYEVRAGSAAAVPREIAPATLRVGRKRRDSNDQLLTP